jgi:Acetyltransferase (GNAT) domain
LFLLLCTPIILVFLPLILSGYNWIDAASNTLASMLFLTSICLAFLWIFIWFLSLSKIHKIWILEKNNKSIAAAHFDFKYGFSCLIILNVAKNSRNKGYGSYLICWLCLHVPKPIYVVSASRSTGFYAKLGFSFLVLSSCPQNLDLT